MGFDNECITNIQSLLGEYFCPVCRTLVYPLEALQTQCTHLYCKPCLSYVANSTKACPYDGYLVTEADAKPLVESNKALADTIEKVSVHCLYHKSGCTWQGPLSECTSHCSLCTFGNSPVMCNRCGVQIVHRQVQEHAQNCSGVQPQPQKPSDVQSAATTGTGAASAQSQSGVQTAATTSQPQISQSPAATQAVPDPNKQASATVPTQTVNAVPTQEQWYQHQQQYQQYYQQYPGYNPYQQNYQQYYPYQQQVQQYQQQPGQQQPQAYGQSLTQPQAQQLQSQAQPQPQQQPQVASVVHPQPHAQVASNSHLQAVPLVRPESQYQAQSQVPSHGLSHPLSQPFPPAQSYPQATQPVVQQPTQTTQYQQTNPQMQHSTLQVQPQPYPHPHPQPYPHAQSQQQPQGQLTSHPNPQPPVHPPSQPSQSVNPSTQMQVYHPAAHAVTGYQAYQQPQAHQQTQAGPHSLPMTGPQQQLQHPVHMQGQYPQQPTLMRPPQPHAMLSNQQQVAALPAQAQPPSAPAQQTPAFPHSQQSGYPALQRPAMLPGHHAMPQQYGQQPSFPGQGSFAQQQSSMQTQLRGQALPLAPQQLNYAQPHAAQADMARPLISQAAGPQAYVQAPAGAGHMRPMQPGMNQLPVNQYSLNSSQLSQSSEQPRIPVQQLPRPVGGETNTQDPENTKKDASLGMKAGDMNHVKSENDVNYANERNSLSENMPEPAGRELSQQKRMFSAESESHLVDNGASAEESKPKVKEEVTDDRAVPSVYSKSAGTVAGIQGFPASTFPPSQCLPGSNSLASSDHGRNPLLPMGYVPPLQQRPTAPSGAPQKEHPPTQSRLHGPGQFDLPGSHLGAPDYPNPPVLKHPPTSVYAENSSGGILGPSNSASFARGPGNLGPVPASLAQQRNPQAEPFGVPPFASQPTGTLDAQGGIMGRAPMYPSDGGMAHRLVKNSMEVDIVQAHRPGYFDGRQSDSHRHGPMERGTYRQPPAGQPNAVKINGPPGCDRSPTHRPRDERLKLPPEDLREFEEDLKKFPRPSHSDFGPPSKFVGHFPSSGALDQVPHAFGMDGLPRSCDMKTSGTFPSRFLPPFPDSGDRHRPSGFGDDPRGRAEFGISHPDFQGPGFGRHHMDGLPSRSPGREHTAPPYRFGGFSGEIDGNEFGQGSKPFDIPLDPLGKPDNGGRFPPPPSNFQRGEFDLRMADPLVSSIHNNSRVSGAQDMLPTHFKRGEYLGPHGLPMGVATGLGPPFGSHPQMIEPPAGGNFPPCRPSSESFGGDRPPHLGEPGFRSRYALDGGFFPGKMELFDNSRKRKPGSIMCRICKLDCGTVDGLDLHSQTREHQKRAVDMVLAIKKQNKKQKTSGGRPLFQARSKPRGAGSEGRVKKR